MAVNSPIRAAYSQIITRNLSQSYLDKNLCTIYIYMYLSPVISVVPLLLCEWESLRSHASSCLQNSIFAADGNYQVVNCIQEAILSRCSRKNQACAHLYDTLVDWLSPCHHCIDQVWSSLPGKEGWSRPACLTSSPEISSSSWSNASPEKRTLVRQRRSPFDIAVETDTSAPTSLPVWRCCRNGH